MKKVWAYTMSKALSASQIDQLLREGETFVSNWTAHENKLSAEFEIFAKRIILVKVNEAVYDASGCSIDKLQRFIKSMEFKFEIELLNRLLVVYEKGDEVEVIPVSKVKESLDNGTIHEDTAFFITSISTETELLNWKQPLKNTWLAKYLQKV